MKNAIWWGIMAVLLSAAASASVVISQVLYNPLWTESGGEAVELYNDGAESADISGWKIATEASMSDAVIPPDTILCPGCYYIVADTGWDDSKDNSTWANADYEELINLYNSDSGVALVDGSGIIDAVGWGNPDLIEDGFFQGAPAAHVLEGNSLVRISRTGINADDFAESYPVFSSGYYTGAEAASKEADIEFEISNSSNSSGKNTVSISISPSSLDFGVLSGSEGSISEIKITNTGNTSIDIGIKCPGFNSSNGFAEPGSIYYSFGSEFSQMPYNIAISDINLEPGEEASLKLKINSTRGIAEGKYAGKVTIIALQSKD